MPITSFLNGVKFDRETTRVMGVAFEMTRMALGLSDRFDQANELVAKRIIDLAKQGECNPDVLCERAFASNICSELSGRDYQTYSACSR